MSPDDEPAADTTGAQRHHLTLLFADLCDSTRLAERMEAEDYAAVLDGLRAACRDIVPRHGGQIARMQGDGVLAFFGWPQPAEDDGRRAAEAALELHAAVAALGAGIALPAGAALRLHSGIHAGLVLLAHGDVERGRFELLGNAPNIAARLSSLGAADEIVVSEATLGPQLQYLATGERQTVHLRGREAPLQVYRVLGRAAAGGRHGAPPRRPAARFVGRDRELRVLHELLRAARAGRNVCCVVSAPPGIGKSRLIDEFVAAARPGCRPLRGDCDGAPGAVPLQPFLQVVAALLAGGDPALERLDAALVDAARALLSTGIEQPGERAIATLRELFDALAAHEPLLLVLDDWQWADEASQKVLQALRLLSRPLCVLLATRTRAGELLLTRPAQALELGPLDAAAAAQVVHALLPRADPFVVADIQQRAGGVPLYIEELCHAVQQHGPGWQADIGLDSAGWLGRLIESRVGRLPAEQARIVRAAAVLGNVFPDWLLERLTGHRADDPAVRALAEHDFVFAAEPPGTLRFKHGITRDAIYATVGLHQRQRMHRQIADALAAEAGDDADAHVEALALHCAAGALPERAAVHAERAGDKALAASALDRARDHYVAALDAIDRCAAASSDDGLRWCAVVQKLGLAFVFDPLSLRGAVALFERGVALARHSGRLDQIARAEYWLSYALYATGRALAARSHCEAALAAALQVGDERLAARARAVHGQVLLAVGDYPRALPLLDAALSGRRPAGGRPGALAVGAAYTLACKGCLLGDRGRFDEAHACFDEAMQLIGDSRHQVASSVRHWRCVVLQWQGRWDEALPMADDSAQIAELTRSRHQLSMGRAMAGYVRWKLSGRAGDLQALRDATAWIEAHDGRLGISLNHGWIVEAALDSGLDDVARRHAARLFLRARQADRLGEALGCRALARAAARRGHFEHAERYLARAAQAAASRGSAHEQAGNRLCEAQISVERGQAARARSALQQAMAAFESMSMHGHLQQARQLAAGV